MDTASPAPEFLRPWGRNAQCVRDPTHADATEPCRGDRILWEMRVILFNDSHCIRGCDAFLRAARATGAGCDRLIWARIARCVVYSPLGARAAS